MLKRSLKNTVRLVSFIAVFPAAAIAGFGRIKPLYIICAQMFALAPGIIGDYLRVTFYRLTLESYSIDSRVSFGSFFAHPQARVGSGVYIGSYCVLGRTEIGNGTQIASAVQILSGQHQHARDEHGAITGAEMGTFKTVRIGASCWIGAGAIVMADIGEGSTIGAGSVVTAAIPAQSVAVGSPARVIKKVTVSS